jgi:hypothetical protein
MAVASYVVATLRKQGAWLGGRLARCTRGWLSYWAGWGRGWLSEARQKPLACLLACFACLLLVGCLVCARGVAICLPS